MLFTAFIVNLFWLWKIVVILDGVDLCTRRWGNCILHSWFCAANIPVNIELAKRLEILMKKLDLFYSIGANDINMAGANYYYYLL